MGDTASGTWGSRELGRHIAEERMKMSRVPTNSITAERLARWAKRLDQEHATPILLFGVGHDEVSGQLVVCTCDEVSDDVVAALLRSALKKIEDGRVTPR